MGPAAKQIPMISSCIEASLHRCNYYVYLILLDRYFMWEYFLKNHLQNSSLRDFSHHHVPFTLPILLHQQHNPPSNSPASFTLPHNITSTKIKMQARRSNNLLTPQSLRQSRRRIRPPRLQHALQAPTRLSNARKHAGPGPRRPSF